MTVGAISRTTSSPAGATASVVVLTCWALLGTALVVLAALGRRRVVGA